MNYQNISAYLGKRTCGDILAVDSSLTSKDTLSTTVLERMLVGLQSKLTH